MLTADEMKRAVKALPNACLARLCRPAGALFGHFDVRWLCMHMPVLHARPCVCVPDLCSSRATSAHVGIGIYQIYPPKIPRVKWPNLLRCSSSECVALTQAGTRTGPHFPCAFYSQVIVCKEIGYKKHALQEDHHCTLLCAHAQTSK